MNIEVRRLVVFLSVLRGRVGTFVVVGDVMVDSGMPEV
jgi:hypothetical protein